MEKKEEVRTFITRKYCDCGGEFKSNGRGRLTYPEQHGYMCEKCGDEFWSTKSYPVISYEPIDTQENG